jgi:hypothetical protein
MKVKIDSTDKFAYHLAATLCMYGDCYVDWFNEEGCDLFYKWAEQKGIEFWRLDGKSK